MLFYENLLFIYQIYKSKKQKGSVFIVNVTNFKGVLIYTESKTNYTDENIKEITSKSPYVLDYVILDNDITSDSVIIDKLFEVAKQIYRQKTSSRIWLGTPTYNSSRALTYNQIRTFLTNLKARFLNDTSGDYCGRKIWNNAVKGIYMNMESVYGTVNYTSSSTLLSNTSIKLANDVSYFVHNTLENNSKLNFLWIPYYGYDQYTNGVRKTNNAATIIKNIGYVTSRTNIFDIVIIQPAFYEYDLGKDSNGNQIVKDPDSILETNLNGVKYSIIKNSVCYRNNVEVISRSSSAAAVIGFEMEIDSSFDATENNTRGRNGDRYNKYVDKFINYRNKPMCYYAGGKFSLINCISNINKFYNLSITNASNLKV